MSGINKVILIGNLGADPEIRYMQDNVPVAHFSIATTESYKDKAGDKKEVTEWHNIVAFRGLAGVIEKYLKKGNKVYIEGKLKTSNWEDKEGIKRYKTEIVAGDMIMLDRPGSSGNGNNKPQEADTNVTESAANEPAQGDDDLPF